MLKECFFEQLSSLYEFATNHYLSHNPVYKEFKQFKLILKEYDIDVTKEFQLVGEESEIREFIFLFFMKEYYLDHSPFPKEILEKEKSFARFNESNWLNHKQSARMRIRKKHYLGIILSRMHKGHHMQNTLENDLIMPKHLVIIDELKSWLQEILAITDQEVLECAARDILRFLIVEGWLIDNNSYIDQEQTYIQQLNTDFIQSVQQQFSLTAETLTTPSDRDDHDPLPALIVFL